MKNSAWGFVAKWLYIALRPKIANAVKDTKNTLDDSVLEVLDVLAGVNDGKGK